MKKFITFAASLALAVVASLALSCASLGPKKDTGPGPGRVYTRGDTAELKKEYSISGTVLDSKTKKAVAGARVEIKNANMGIGYYLATTDSSGKFTIKDFIPHLNYIVEIEAAGYVTYLSGGAVSPGSHEISMDREAILAGTVSDASGGPLDGVEVRLQRGYSGDYSGGTKRPLVAKSDRSGRYSFDKLVQDTYSVTFTRSGYIAETASVRYVKSGETFSLPMRLFRPASISGKVIIGDLNAPAINVSVIAKGKVTHSASTFHDGTYQLGDLRPGRYRMEVYHEGFYKLEPRTLEVREGDEIKDADFTVSPKTPEVKIYTYKYTFAPGNKVSFNMRSFRLESVKATVYRVPMETFLRGKSEPNDVVPVKEGFSVAASWEETVQDFKPYEWKYQAFELKDLLPTGGYCMEVKGPGGVMDRKYFTVTSVGIVVKRSQQRIVAYVTDLVTSLPVPEAQAVVFDITPVKETKKRSSRTEGAPERIEDLPVDILESGKTDARGLFTVAMKSDRHLAVLVIGNDGSYALASTGSPARFQREQVKYMIYTDRPVYRAGDTVHYKIIGKERRERFAPLGGNRIHYSIVNRDTSKEMKTGEHSLDGWGTAHDSVLLDAEGDLGVYEIRVGPDKKNLYSRGKFYVEQYRKPEFKIDVTPSKEYFINGDTVEFKVEGRYFFGAPIKNAIIRYRFYETQLRDADTRYWWEDEDQGGERSYRRLRLEGEKYLDDNGVVNLQLQSGNLPYDRAIALEVTVVDKSNVSITSSGSVRVGRGEFYIKIEPVQSFFASNEKKEVIISTLTQTGKPLRARVNLDLYRYIWKPYQRIYVHEKRPFYSMAVETGENGKAAVHLPEKFTAYGEFDIIATGTDSRNNMITASRVIWVYSPTGSPVSSRFRNLEISVNSPVMERPGKITALIKSRFAGGHVLVTLEGKDVYHSRVVAMKGNVMPLELDVRADYAPNFSITATMQQKRALFTSTAEISLPVVDTGLRIALSTDKEKYLPGEKATVTIAVTDEKGKPLGADLSLAAVDESIYSIRPDHTPKMQDYFYSRISNWVLTSYSYPITVLAGAGKDGKVKIREKFRDTAFWKADVRTSPSGTGSVTFELPDNLTTWRLTVRGHDMAGRMGEKKMNFMVTQDLIARIGRPRFMVEGDEMSLLGIVNSNTTRGLPAISVEFQADGKTIDPVAKTPLSLPGFGSLKTVHPFAVPGGKGDVALQFKAVADREARDGLKISVPVEKRGSLYKFYGYGDMALNRKVDLSPLKETDDFSFVPESLTISFNPSPVMQMVKATRFLVEYPYGCVEQSINRFLPLLAVHGLLKEKNMQGLLDEKTLKALPDMVKSGIARLEASQNDDGTWGWWAGDAGNEFITGYALTALHLARKNGYRTGDNARKLGVAAVERMLDKENHDDPDAQAFLLYILSLNGKWSLKAYRSLMALKVQNPYRLAYILRALSVLNSSVRIDERETKELLARRETLKDDMTRRLDVMQKKDDRGIYWASGDGQAWGWPGGDTEVTAHVLAALVDSGNRSPLPGQVVRSLSKRGRGECWSTTKQTASVVLSMTEYLRSIGGGLDQKADVTFRLGGDTVATFTYTPGESLPVRDLVKKVPIPASRGGKLFQVTAEGTAGGDAAFDLALQGYLAYKPSGFLSLFKSEERSLSSLSNGLQIHRSFSGITRVMDMNRNEYLVPGKLDESKSIGVGDEILVKIKFTALDDFEYLVLEDFLPAGFEVTGRNAYDEYRPYVREERWDNRMVFFFNNLSKGTVYEVAYIIRAELPGKFMVRPARMECMYEPLIQGWSAPVIIRVIPK